MTAETEKPLENGDDHAVTTVANHVMTPWFNINFFIYFQESSQDEDDDLDNETESDDDEDDGECLYITS